MIQVRDLQELQLDALREMANIGAGHAATALSQMVRATIRVDVPNLQMVPLEQVSDLLRCPDEVVAAVLMHMLGDLTGRTLLIFPRSSALRLSAVLLGRGEDASATFGEMEQSAVKEVGNILASAYMNALSECMGLMLIPSVPALVVDLCGAVMTSVHTDFGGESWDVAMSIETEFRMDGEEERLRGYFLLMPDPSSLQKILESIRVA